ncbi:hypothetical protein Hanom_Chr03g00258031 [Helianthus anomalus]
MVKMTHPGLHNIVFLCMSPTHDENYFLVINCIIPCYIRLGIGYLLSYRETVFRTEMISGGLCRGASPRFPQPVFVKECLLEA